MDETKAKQRELSAELLELQNKLLGCDDDQYKAVKAQVVKVEAQIAANMMKLRGLDKLSELAAAEASDAVLPDDAPTASRPVDEAKAKQRQLSAQLLELQNKLLGCDDDQYKAVKAQVANVEAQIAANMEKIRGLEPAAAEASDAVLPDNAPTASRPVDEAKAKQQQLSAQLLELQNKLLGCDDDELEAIEAQVADVEAQIAASMKRVSELGLGLSGLNEQLAQAQREMLQASTKAKKKAHKKRCAELDAMISAARAKAKEAAQQDAANAAEEVKAREAAAEEKAKKAAAKKAAEAAAKKAAQEEAAATKAAEEKAKKQAEEEAAQEKAAQEEAKKAAEEKAAATKAAEEKAKKAAEEEQVRISKFSLPELKYWMEGANAKMLRMQMEALKAPESAAANKAEPQPAQTQIQQFSDIIDFARRRLREVQSVEDAAAAKKAAEEEKAKIDKMSHKELTEWIEAANTRLSDMQMNALSSPKHKGKQVDTIAQVNDSVDYAQRRFKELQSIEEAAKKAAAKKAAEEEEAKNAAARAEVRQAVQAAAKRAAEAAKKVAAAEEAEAAAKRVEEAAKKVEEAAAKKVEEAKKVAEEAAAARKAEEAAAAKKAAEEEAAAKKAAEEAIKRAAKEAAGEALRQAEARKAEEAAAAKKAAEEEAAAEEAIKQAAKEAAGEALRQAEARKEAAKSAAKEQARNAAQEAAAKKAAEEQARNAAAVVRAAMNAAEEEEVTKDTTVPSKALESVGDMPASEAVQAHDLLQEIGNAERRIEQIEKLDQEMAAAQSRIETFKAEICRKADEDSAKADEHTIAATDEDQAKRANAELCMMQTAMLQQRKERDKLAREVEELRDAARDERAIGESYVQQLKQANNDLLKMQSAMLKQSRERDMLALKVKQLKVAAVDGQATETDYEQKLEQANEALVVVQASLVQQREECDVLSQKVVELEASATDEAAIEESYEEKLTQANDDLLKVQATMLKQRNERDMLAQEVDELRSAALEDGATAVYLESISAAYEEQIKQMNEELCGLQTAMLQKLSADDHRYMQQKSKESEQVESGEMAATGRVQEQQPDEASEGIRAVADATPINKEAADIDGKLQIEIVLNGNFEDFSASNEVTLLCDIDSIMRLTAGCTQLRGLRAGSIVAALEVHFNRVARPELATEMLQLKGAVLSGYECTGVIITAEEELKPRGNCSHCKLAVAEHQRRLKGPDGYVHHDCGTLKKKLSKSDLWPLHCRVLDSLYEQLEQLQERCERSDSSREAMAVEHALERKEAAAREQDLQVAAHEASLLSPAELRAQLADARGARGEFEIVTNTVTELAETKAELKNVKSQLTNALISTAKHMKAQRIKATAEATEMKQVLNAKQTALLMLAADKAHVETALGRAELSKATLEQYVKTADLSNCQLKAELKEQAAKNSQLQAAKNCELQAAKDSQLDQAVSSNDKLSELQAALDRADLDKEAMGAELQAVLGRAELDKEAMQVELAESQKESEATIAGLESKVKAAATNNGELEVQSKHSDAKVQGLQQQVQNLEAKADELESSLKGALLVINQNSEAELIAEEEAETRERLEEDLKASTLNAVLNAQQLEGEVYECRQVIEMNEFSLMMISTEKKQIEAELAEHKAGREAKLTVHKEQLLTTRKDRQNVLNNLMYGKDAEAREIFREVKETEQLKEQLKVSEQQLLYEQKAKSALIKQVDRLKFQLLQAKAQYSQAPHPSHDLAATQPHTPPRTRPLVEQTKPRSSSRTPATPSPVNMALEKKALGRSYSPSASHSLSFSADRESHRQFGGKEVLEVAAVEEAAAAASLNAEMAAAAAKTVSREVQDSIKAGLVRTQMGGVVSREVQDSIKAGLVRTQMGGVVSRQVQDSIKAGLVRTQMEDVVEKQVHCAQTPLPVPPKEMLDIMEKLAYSPERVQAQRTLDQASSTLGQINSMSLAQCQEEAKLYGWKRPGSR